MKISTARTKVFFFFVAKGKKKHSDECKNCMNVAHAMPWPCARLHSEVLLFHYLFNHCSSTLFLCYMLNLCCLNNSPSISFNCYIDSGTVPCLVHLGLSVIDVDRFSEDMRHYSWVSGQKYSAADENRAGSQIQTLTSLCLIHTQASDSLVSWPGKNEGNGRRFFPETWLDGILLLSFRTAVCAFSRDAPIWRPAISPRQNIQRHTLGPWNTGSIVAEFNFFN